MILFFILRTYFKDVKELGKENLAVSLKERLCRYFLLIGISALSLIGILIDYFIYYSLH